MHANQKPRRRHSKQFKAQVLAACAEPGASVAAVAMSFGVNANLVRQWQRGRGYEAPTPEVAGTSLQEQTRFVPVPLPAAVPAAVEAIHVQLQRGTLAVSVTWPVSASSQCSGWLRELLR